MSQKYFCPNCGSAQDPEAKFCQNCGSQIKGQAQQSQNQPVTQQPVIMAPSQSVSQVVEVNVPGTYQVGPSQKSRLTALVLCLIFGWAGIHRFYVGKVGSGILYLLTVGIWGIGWAIDCIVILLGGFKDATNQMVTTW
ncbi:MAG: TM2 domain-containing protein [Candidatus Heimdallarchaeota archaeon]|nr:TM2 domain-containing protein [Candidatus Heimdallarchaeota archaeon]